MLWGGGGCTIGERVCFGAESSFGRLLLEVWGGVVAELWHGGSLDELLGADSWKYQSSEDRDNQDMINFNF